MPFWQEGRDYPFRGMILSSTGGLIALILDYVHVDVVHTTQCCEDKLTRQI